MKTKFFLGILLSILLITSAFSGGGALRFVLPFISEIVGSLKEGEIAYDSSKKVVIYKNDSDVVQLASNPDISAQNYLPFIESSVRSSDIFSYIHPGKIRIGNRVYTNSSAISCFYKDSSPTTNWGYHDGTSKSLTIPSGYTHPIFLYLVEDGSNFDCIFSFNSNGPASSYGSVRWTRVATIVGNSSKNNLRTIDGITSVTGTTINFYGPIPTPTLTSFSYLIASSMKYITLGTLQCYSGKYVYVYETIMRPDSSGVPTGYGSDLMYTCANDDTKAEYRFYPNGSTDIKYATDAFNFAIPLQNWAEKPLSSI
jgi:hypothetical protein